MPLLKNGRIADDPWHLLADNDPLPEKGPVIVSLTRWRALRDALAGRPDGVGIILKSNELSTEIEKDVEYFSLICLDFPSFRDGRHFSTARILRERLGYRGELRAVGNVLRDQLLFMHRCGFDAYEVTDPRTVAGWESALAEISVWYQTTADGRTSAPALRRSLASTLAPVVPQEAAE